MKEALKTRHIQPLLEFIDINKQLTGLAAQKDKHEIALKNISQLIKELKANRTKKLRQMIGGNLIVEIDGKEAISMLQKRKEEIEIGLKSLDEQLMHRSDGFESAAIKVYNVIKHQVPDDILEE